MCLFLRVQCIGHTRDGMVRQLNEWMVPDGYACMHLAEYMSSFEILRSSIPYPSFAE